MKIEIHLLHNLPFNCLNSDGAGNPKTLEFAGRKRARISSQAWKRAMRMALGDSSTRSRVLVGRIADGINHESAPQLVHKALTMLCSGIKVEVKDGEENTATATNYILLLNDDEISRIRELVVEHQDTLEALCADKPPKSVKDAGREVSRHLIEAVDGQALDVALWGRFIADAPDYTRDASCQVAHSMSTNIGTVESDYWSCVDDLTNESGAAHIGTSEFNSSCHYRYLAVDFETLVANLNGDTARATSGIGELIKVTTTALPTGRSNVTAPNTMPSLVMIVVRGSGQWSLANAFAQPASATYSRDVVAHSARKLHEHWDELTKAYGDDQIQHVSVLCAESRLKDQVSFDKEIMVESLADLVDRVSSAIGGGA